LPLIASPSNATAKVFIMSQGMELYLQDDLFNLDKAQIFANCVMAYLVYSGHHSFLEVAEIWNRQLDFVATEDPEQLPRGVIPIEKMHLIPYMEDTDVPKRKLPYAVAGNYSHFNHFSYRITVIVGMESQLTKGLDLGFESHCSI
jgi:hypothetical protein